MHFPFFSVLRKNENYNNCKWSATDWKRCAAEVVEDLPDNKNLFDEYWNATDNYSFFHPPLLSNKNDNAIRCATPSDQ